MEMAHNPLASFSSNVEANGRLGRVTTAINSPRVTVYDKLTALSEEIVQGIYNIHAFVPPSGKGDALRKDELTQELAALRESSFSERSPEAEYALRLFRYYADMANAALHSMKNGDAANGQRGNADSVALFEVPPFVYEGSPEQLSGWSAVRKNIFWSRAFSALFSFLAFVVMACTPFITHNDLAVGDILLVRAMKSISFSR